MGYVYTDDDRLKEAKVALTPDGAKSLCARSYPGSTIDEIVGRADDPRVHMAWLEARRLDSPELLADVATGVVYINCVRAVNEREKKATA